MRPAPAPAAALALAVLALVLAGCTDPDAPLLRFEGRGCTEVGLLLPGNMTKVRAALPEGLEASRDAQGRAVVAVAFNHCLFRTGTAEQAAWEAFVWLAVGPAPDLVLRPGGPHAFDALHWREAGAMLQASTKALPRTESAAFEGPARFAAGEAFDVAARPSTGGVLRMRGTAAAPTGSQDHPEGPCCRTFATGPEGLVRTDYTSTDQPQGAATCTLQTDLLPLVGLLGAAQAEGPCVHNAGYDFTAEVRRV